MLRLKLFGALCVWNAEEIEVLGPGTPRQKPKALLAYLYLQRGQFVARDELLAALWPELDDPGSGRLKQTALVLRKLIEPSPSTPRYVLQRSGAYYFNTFAEHSSDLEEFDRELLLARGEVDLAPGRAMHHYVRAFGLRRGPLLAEFAYEPWVADPAGRHRTEYLDALDEAAQLALRRDDTACAISLGRRAMQEDPLRESSAIVLMRALERHGRDLEAIRIYEALSRRLQARLDLAPSSELSQVYEDLRSRRATSQQS